MPAQPRWLLAIPDAIQQLEQLDQDLLIRRDLERLFGVSKVRATQLMTDLRRRPDRAPADPAARRAPAPAPPTAPDPGRRSAARRRAATGSSPRSARPDSPGSGWRCPARPSRRAWPACPTACRSRPGGSRCASAARQDAVGRLFALAQALTNDYERFEALVEGGDLAGGGGAVRA